MKLDKIQSGVEVTDLAALEVKALLSILEEHAANFPVETNALLTLLENRKMSLTPMLKRLSNKNRPEEINKIRNLIYVGIDEAEALVHKEGKESSDARLKKLADDIAEIWKEFQI